MTRKTGLVWLLLLFCTAVRASNLRQISSREGISNNAILSLAQDKHGFIWVGSCDGLNMWDGERMRLFPNDWGGETPLSGNLIEEIAVTTDSLFWIRTNYGLDLFDPDSKRVERHADFQGMYKIVTRRSNEVLVVTQDNKFSCYDPAARRFSSVQPMSGIDYADILDMQLDDDGALWVFSRKGIFRIPVAFPDKNNDRIGIGQPERFPTVSNPEYAFAENGSGFFIDENHIFYEFDIRERRLIYNKDMSDEMARMGSVSSIVRDGGDYIVSFYTNGVIRLRTTPEQSVTLPNLSAGCSMADMANIDQVQECWDQLGEICGTQPDSDGLQQIIPVTYMNSSAALKAFCGRNGGIVCTSSNAHAVLEWAFARGKRVLFFPDQHLGRNTARAMGIPLSEMPLWDPFKAQGGAADPADYARAKMILWKGFCSVHQRFTVEQVERARKAYPGVKVIVHPECSMPPTVLAPPRTSSRRSPTRPPDPPLLWAPKSTW